MSELNLAGANGLWQNSSNLNGKNVLAADLYLELAIENICKYVMTMQNEERKQLAAIIGISNVRDLVVSLVENELNCKIIGNSELN